MENPFKQFEYKPRTDVISQMAPICKETIDLSTESSEDEMSTITEPTMNSFYTTTTYTTITTKTEMEKMDICREKDDNRVSYIYLIREREHLEANRNVYKFGRSCQLPENYIGRLRQYKKGSEIIMVLKCEDAIQTENRIRDIFKVEFRQHRDGHEHYYGDVRQMMKIIWEQVIN